ncbi:DNA primase large subunit Spp2 [Schizosaccharomyces cryophilus OY26]|uniref:DNA primase large subunit n=1 Tax=Schizosaccharomyces cryophilus (strain OY26 / ATCC MYA-4695 / CBS 11777 / NBRC 106824 / NRRL Y48691) TaxID=653667 RepID=S9VWP6_SCHCR|nr:DNA primase large subunit Spp2 [Schizosaccharomyces cryophilus OY26]EPY50669.1 DNA primase large subunit Spp2 [Schizosaccharomyces cryophilus OY26]
MFRSTKSRAVERNRNFARDVPANVSYPTRLNFYLNPPHEEISIEEFETWAIDRLYVLGEIESALFRNKTKKELDMIIKRVVDKHLPMSSNMARVVKGAGLDEERRKDHYSHFILRLAFSRSEELRYRFLRAESALFKYRFINEETRERQYFVDSLNFQWNAVSKEEKSQFLSKIQAACQRNVENESFFKVPFIKVPDLVERRAVFVHKGFAYVPFSEQISIVIEEFEKNLKSSLENTAKALPRLDEDDRLLPILNHLSKGFVAPELSVAAAKPGEVTADQVDSLVPHFPLCARHLHNVLRKEKHLRHFSRLQYGLFLKDIGLSVEEALIFWKSSFSNTNDDKFNKEYRYNIRHSYGLEGNRKNYKGYSCQQILTGPQLGPGDAHGCPYRTYSLDNLVTALSTMGIAPDSSGCREVVDAVKGRHYHIACTRVFELTHPQKGTLEESIHHPLQYYQLSTEHQ